MKFLIALVIFLSFSSISFALNGRMYDPATTETLTGEVTRVDKVSPLGRMGYGVHLTLKTEDGEFDVRLGPSQYLSHIGLNVADKDNLKVTGSKVTVNNQTFIIAAEVDKDGKVFVLRDKNGLPMWRMGNR